MPEEALPAEWVDAAKRAADALRYIARDEGFKAMIMTNPQYEAVARRVSTRYVAGETIDDALARATATNASGHACTIDYMGESCRDAALANCETEEFLRLIAQISSRGIKSSVSLDISHIGSVIDQELGRRNLLRVVENAAGIGQEVMISMEGSERTDELSG